MPANVSWSVDSGGSIALPSSGGSAKTLLSATAPAGKVVSVTEIGVGFDGNTAADKPVQVVLNRSTGTAGTSTSVTPSIYHGDASYTTGLTAGKNYSAEPGTLVALQRWQ